MTSEYVEINGHDGYEISREGKVRSASTKKFKKVYQDSTLQHFVLLVDQKSEYTSPFFIADLVEEHFGNGAKKDYIKEAGEPEKTSYQSLLKKYKDLAKKRGFSDGDASSVKQVIKPASQGKRRSKLICNETGEEFRSYREAADHFGVSYDKFYNSIYYYGKFNDMTFSKA